jgi:hypothetical protein
MVHKVDLTDTSDHTWQPFRGHNCLPVLYALELPGEFMSYVSEQSKFNKQIYDEVREMKKNDCSICLYCVFSLTSLPSTD